MAVKFGVFVDGDHCKFPTLYYYPNFIKDPINHVLLLTLLHALLLSKPLTSCLTTIENRVKQFMRGMVKFNLVY